MVKPNNEQEELVRKIVDTLIKDIDKLTSVTHWGEPSMLLCDVINTINNVAGTDYKRYSSYGSNLKSEECKPNNTSFYCYACAKFFANNKDKQGCLGFKVINRETDKENKCKDYEGKF